MKVIYRLGILFIFLFGFWMTYPALSLPHAIIDDQVILDNSSRWFKLIGEGNIREAVAGDFGVQARVFNLGFTGLNAIRYRLTGLQPYHWIRLGQLALVAAAMFWIVSRVPERRMASMVGAGLAVLLFLVAEVPMGIDLQALRVNWFRLFTADPDALTFLLPHFIAVAAIYNGGHGRLSVLVLSLLAVVCGAITFSIKIPYLAMVCAPTAVLAVCAWFYRDRKAAIVLVAIIVSVLALFFGYSQVLRGMAPPADQAGYTQSYSLKAGHLFDGFKYYWMQLWDMLGPFFPALLAGLVILAIHFWNDRRSNKKSIGLFLYLLAFTVLGFGMYIPWNHRLPRYMLAGVAGLAMLSGLCSGYGLHRLHSVYKSNMKGLLALPLGMAATLLPPLALVAVLVMAVGLSGLRRVKDYSHPLIAGVALAGILYIGLITPVVRSATNNHYVSREFANWQATLTVLKLSAEGKTVCFAGDVYDEHIGSMAGHIARMGIEPKTASTSDQEKCTSGSYILVHKVLSPPEIVQSLPLDNLVKQINIARDSYEVPISFWEFRKRLLGQEKASSLYRNTWASEYVWRFYGPPGAPAL